MINIETTSNKAKRIRWSDIKTQSKIILDIKWHQLGGNKYPYLSVDIKQVKKNGEIVHCWQKQKQTIRVLNKDLFTLVDNHLKNITCFDGNVGYVFKKALKYFGKTTYTQEDHTERLNQIYDQLLDHKILKLVKWDIEKYLKEYLNQNSDLYKYKNFDDSFDHWENQIARYENPYTYTKRIKPALRDYFDLLKGHRKLKEQYKYRTLPSRSEIITYKDVAIRYNVSECKVLKILASGCKSKELEAIEKEIQINIEKDLQELTEKYNIPLVTTK